MILALKLSSISSLKLENTMPLKDPVKEAAYRKKYYEANKEKAAAHNKKHREENKEKIAAYHKNWREENKEKITSKKRR